MNKDLSSYIKNNLNQIEEFNTQLYQMAEALKRIDEIKLPKNNKKKVVPYKETATKKKHYEERYIEV